ncbi:hypothetical protein [Actinomadura sp. 9N407]|uniref:hypothetical protein n=1 Tax=Actinomadura sp. 9N407 TaxID=3375154 RepID=UPI0037B69BF1
MAQVRVTFTGPQQFGQVRVTELTVEADRLVLMNGGSAVLDVPAEALASADQGSGGRLDRLRSVHPNHGKAWTEQEDTELRRLFGAGVGTGDLGKHFGRSRGAVRSALLRLGLVERGVPSQREG